MTAPRARAQRHPPTTVLAVLLSACGGGREDRGEESTTVNQPPTLQAGPHPVADAGATVCLSGLVDDPGGHIASYDREQTGRLEAVRSGGTTAASGALAGSRPSVGAAGRSGGLHPKVVREVAS